MNRRVVSVDSPADAPQSLIENYDLRVVPLHVNYGLESFRDGVDISPQDVFDRFDESGALPKTSSASVQEYIDFFTGILDEGAEGIVHVSLSSGISGTHQNARLAAQEMGAADRIRVLDSLSLCSGMLFPVLAACQARERGLTTDAMYAAAAEVVPRVDAAFLVGDLTFLRKGGRCTALEALGANALGLRPTLVLNAEGRIVTGKKYRGRRDVCRRKFTEDRVSTPHDARTAFVSCTADFDRKELSALRKFAAEAGGFEETLSPTAGCVITSHCGRDTIGVFLLKKED